MQKEIMAFLNAPRNKFKGTTVQQLSEALMKSRNLLSREINQMVEQGCVVCIESNPKVYYSKSAVEEKYEILLEQTHFESEKVFKEICEQQTAKDFEKLIGCNESLSECVSLCKAAISYPPLSLPVLLNGPTGTGKSLIAQLMYEYAVNHGIIDSKMPFVTVNCSEYANNPELLTANLFGHKKGAFTGAESDNTGLIKAADGGVLFLDEVHCLKPECQEKLFLFMDKGIYHIVGENEKWESAQVRLIFATTEKPEEVLLKTFLRRVPIIVNVPSLQKRGLFEKIQLMTVIFHQEEKRLHRSIRLSNVVYNMFLNHQFEGNIGELKNTIQVCCAKALQRADERSIEIHMDDLPANMFIGTYEHLENDNRMIRLQDLNVNDESHLEIIRLYENILLHYSQSDFMKILNNAVHEYHKNLLYDRKEMHGAQDAFIMNRLESVIQDNLKKYGYCIGNNDLIILFYYIEDIRHNLVSVRKWCRQNENKIKQFNDSVKLMLPHETQIVATMIENLNNTLDITFDEMFCSVLTLYIDLINKNTPSYKRIGIILAHGYSTASSIADATNLMLQDTIFQSMDMPIDMSTDTIVEELNYFLSRHSNYEELFFLVDMGSLEQIYEGILHKQNVNIGIINNITTKITLEIGMGIKNGIPMKELLKNVCDSNVFSYRIIEREKKEDVIVCACASGLGTAERISQLLINALPDGIHLKVITYDYNTLTAAKNNSDLFDKYNVLCIVGTLNPMIENVLFIAIEDLIVNQNMEALEKIFYQRMKDEEIEAFKHELLISFSLSNVMNHLTILNPTKLLEKVAKALDDFQNIYGIRIPNSTSVGLYVHTCCMVERLVTRKEFDNYREIEQFRSRQKHFIECVKAAFKTVEDYYGISINDDEIGYIYDYIYNSSVKEDNEF